MASDNVSISLFCADKTLLASLSFIGLGFCLLNTCPQSRTLFLIGTLELQTGQDFVGLVSTSFDKANIRVQMLTKNIKTGKPKPTRGTKQSTCEEEEEADLNLTPLKLVKSGVYQQ